MSLELMVMALWSFTPVPSPCPSLFINTHGCRWLATEHAPHSTPSVLWSWATLVVVAMAVVAFLDATAA
ncbi:unnamed protein product [Sphagnum jensenii]|uniref:Uncharacterized protein n=1 Tax=Sphagnum jensenii TaxID=128206 RepID=A0ABP0ZXB2_9BRYO